MPDAPLSSHTGLTTTKRRDPGFLNPLARRLILVTFRHLREGTLTIEDGEHTYYFEGSEPGPARRSKSCSQRHGVMWHSAGPLVLAKPIWLGIGQPRRFKM